MLIFRAAFREGARLCGMSRYREALGLVVLEGR